MSEPTSPVAGEPSERRTTRTVVLKRPIEREGDNPTEQIGAVTATIRAALEFQSDERTERALTEASHIIHRLGSLANTQHIAGAQEKARAEKYKAKRDELALRVAEQSWNIEQLEIEVKRLQQENRALRLERSPEDRDADLAGS